MNALRPLFCLAAMLAPIAPVFAQDDGGGGTARATSASYTTLTALTVTPLSNGVQITVRADGLLQYQTLESEGRRVTIAFPDARNGIGKNVWNVNKYPLSHIQLTTPQGAVRGIGLTMTINNFTASGVVTSSTPDGQGVLITIRSDRTIAGPRAGTPTPAPAEQAPKPEARPTTEVTTLPGGLLSLRALRADIHGLIAEIARTTGLSVAVDDAVNRTVSLRLDRVTPQVALQSIATANGLALAQIDGVTMLSEGVPTDLATYRLSGTESFRMQNTQARVASELLPNFLNSYINVNAEQNAVVVTAPTQMLAKIGRDLERVDQPSPQIVIEAIAVEFSENSDQDLGLSITQQRSTSVTRIDPASGALSYTTIGVLPQTFEAKLRALEQTGRARVRARPRIAVVNGKQADLFIGAQRFIQTQFNSFGQTQTRIQPVDVGVKLAITPLTGGNGEITTRIAPEVSNITELNLQTGLPVLSTRRADTTVRIKDGETVAIGGLTLNQEQRSDQRIPLLGDLPLIGPLFRAQKRNRVQTELVIFVTPHVLTAADLQEKKP
jgi:type IV pilus assembly protein PilQ